MWWRMFPREDVYAEATEHVDEDILDIWTAAQRGHPRAQEGIVEPADRDVVFERDAPLGFLHLSTVHSGTHNVELTGGEKRAKPA